MIAGSRSARETAIGEAMFSQLAGTRNLRQSPNQIAANSPCQCQVCRSLQNATVQRVHRIPSLKQTSSAIIIVSTSRGEHLEESIVGALRQIRSISVLQAACKRAYSSNTCRGTDRSHSFDLPCPNYPARRPSSTWEPGPLQQGSCLSG